MPRLRAASTTSSTFSEQGQPSVKRPVRAAHATRPSDGQRAHCVNPSLSCQALIDERPFLCLLRHRPLRAGREVAQHLHSPKRTS